MSNLPFQGIKGKPISLQNFTTEEYKAFIQAIKRRIQAAQIQSF